MSHFDYSAPAEVYALYRAGQRRRRMAYLKFASVAEALRHAVEVLDPDTLKGSYLETEDVRLGADEMATLYRSDEYPLERKK